MEWEIQEDLSNNITEVDGGKVALICSKGWNLGKRIVFVGVAVSSVPIVVPPLVLFSAIGLAFSVPVGIAFAGYTCMDKLMRSLLPPREELTYDEILGQEEMGGENGNEKERGDVVRQFNEDNGDDDGVRQMEGDDRQFVEREEIGREDSEDGIAADDGKKREVYAVEVQGGEENMREFTKEDVGLMEVGERGEDDARREFTERSGEVVGDEKGKEDDVREIGEGGLAVGREENAQQIAEDECSGLRVMVIIDANEEENVVSAINTPEIKEAYEHKKPLSGNGECAFVEPLAPKMLEADSETVHLSSKQDFATAGRTLKGIGTRKEDSVEGPDISFKTTTVVPSEMETMEPADEV